MVGVSFTRLKVDFVHTQYAMESQLCSWRACNFYLALQSILDMELTIHDPTHSAIATLSKAGYTAMPVEQ
jgi:hypothetical protein